MVIVLLVDGQKIAKVSSQISSETRIIRTLLEDYSACLSVDDAHVQSLTIGEVLDPSVVEARLQALGIWSQAMVYHGERREVMEAYLMLCRSNEELHLLKEEINNVVSFYENKERTLLDALTMCATDTVYNRGIATMLHKLLGETSWLLQQAHRACKQMSRENEETLDSSSSDSDDYYDEDSDDCYA